MRHLKENFAQEVGGAGAVVAMASGAYINLSYTSQLIKANKLLACPTPPCWSRGGVVRPTTILVAALSERRSGKTAVIDRRYRKRRMSKLFKPRLRRLDRLFTGCPVYYLTVCTDERRAILSNHDIHESFVRFARNAKDRQVFVGRYVIMPDHVHLFAAFTAQSPSLSMWIKSWKNALSKGLSQMNIPPPHWEKGFFDHVLRSADSYEQKWLYVCENPVRAGLVNRWEDWPYQGEIHPLSVKNL